MEYQLHVFSQKVQIFIAALNTDETREVVVTEHVDTVFLSSDAAATITGSAYSIDGGWVAQ